jgi:hypothetical protein
VNLKSRIIGGSAALALAVGMTAGPAFAVPNEPTPPALRTGDTAWNEGQATSLGVCYGVAIGSLLTPDKLNGLSNTVKRDITSSSKGVVSDYSDPTTVSSCLVNTTRTDLGAAGGAAPKATKFSTKLHSVSTWCGQAANDPNPDVNRPLAGQIQWGWSNGQKTQGYIRVIGFDTTAVAAVWLKGIVAKGPGVGLDISGSVWFLPAAKSKLATGLNLGAAITGDPIIGDGFAVGGGYATGALYALGQAGGCKTGSGTVDLKSIAIGAGLPEPLFGEADTTTGIHFAG